MKIKCVLVLICLAALHNAYAQQTTNYNARLDSADAFITQNKLEEAMRILSPLTSSDKPGVAAKANRLAGAAQIKKKNYTEAEQLLNQSLQIARTVYNRYEEAFSLYYLGRADALQGNFDKVPAIAETAAVLARRTGDEDLEYKINNLLSWAYFMTNTDFDKMLGHEKRQLELVNKNGSELEKAHVYNNLGYDLTVAGTVPLDSAISLMEYANNQYAKAENTQGRWYTLMNLTWQHRLKNDLATAKAYGEKSYNQAIKDNDRHAIIEASFHLGETLIELGNLKDARKYYQTGLKWRGDKTDRDAFVFDVYHARYLWLTGKRSEAISMLEKAVNFLKTSEVFYEMHGRALLASFYLESGNLSGAAEQIKVIEYPRHNYIALETKCLAALTKAKLLQRNGKEAYAQALLDSWLKQAKEINAAQLEKLIKHAANTLS